MKTAVYDSVRADTLTPGDRIEFCGYICLVKAVHDEGLLGLSIDLYNEDEDEDEDEVSFGAHVMVDLVHDTYED